jgi:hypothetical protein
MKLLTGLLAALFIFIASHAEAKNVLILRGMFGEVVAPMTDIAASLQKKGHKVTLGSWRAPPTGVYDVVITHSAADRWVNSYGRAKVISLDPTFLNPGCKGCVNYYNPMNKIPFILCCGGYRMTGANNVVVPAPHVAVPSASIRHIEAQVGK